MGYSIAGAPLKGTDTASAALTIYNRTMMDWPFTIHRRLQTITTLRELEQFRSESHERRQIFLSNGGHVKEKGETIEHFNIPKIGYAHHFQEDIQLKGSLYGKSTRASERYHSSVSKKFFSRTNHRDTIVTFQLLKFPKSTGFKNYFLHSLNLFALLTRHSLQHLLHSKQSTYGPTSDSKSP